MTCRYDRDAGDYLTTNDAGEPAPCRRDEYGDPTKHCQGRRCSAHIGVDELTCPRCIGRVRSTIAVIVKLATLAHPVALEQGSDSAAAVASGPAADPRVVDEIREYVRHQVQHGLSAGKISDERAMEILTALPDDDHRHPYTVLTRWQLMLAEDYGHPLPPVLSIAGAADYLSRTLTRMAQDPEQDFNLLAKELRAVRSWLETAVSLMRRRERGAPCPLCSDGGTEAKFVRLVREYGHWCDDEDCDRIHYDDDSGDEWVCPRNRREHRWTHDAYSRWIEERKAAG